MRRSVLRVLVIAVVAAVVGAAAVPVSAAPVDDPTIIEGEMLVRFEPGTKGSERAQTRSRHGLTKVRDLPIDGVELVRFDADDDPRTKGQRMRLERSVRWAEPNRRWTAAELAPPNDPGFGDQWALHNTDPDNGTDGPDIGAVDAWAVAASTADVIVAVIDTGVDVSHPDLASQVWVNEAEADGKPDVDDDGNGYVDDLHGWDWHQDNASIYDGDTDGDGADDDAHGTHVAGTIAATRDNGAGVAGVSDARIMPLKFLGPDGGTTADAVLALDYAIEMGAHVTNNSWGGGAHSQALADKITEAQAAGVWFVAAAGNDAADIDAAPTYPASFPHANVVSVAATDRDDALAAFSNHGATSVDLGAPGDSILSLLPSNQYGFMSGTSMAAPHVAGALAHVVAAYPALSMADAKQLLLDRTERVPALATNTVSGGRLDLARVLGVGIDAPTLAISDAQVAEGKTGAGGQLVMGLALSAPHPDAVVVEWATGAPGDTATADVDYLPVTAGRTTIPAGATSATVSIDIVGDEHIEPDETVTVTLATATGATITDGVAVATIVADDRPSVSVTGPAEPIAESGGTATFTVSLSEPGLGAIDVGYRIEDGTAVAGTDVDDVAGTLRFDGTTSATVEVAAVDDAVDEPDERFSLVLHDAVGADIADGAAEATIADDDVAPPPPTGGGGGGGTLTGGTGGTTTGGSGGTTTGGTGGTTDGTSGETSDDSGATGPAEDEESTDTPPEETLPAGAHRLAGGDRVDTAVQVSQSTWGDGEAGSVVLARGDDYPDALAGGALAVAVDAPLLLTSSSALPPTVAAEVRRVLPLGGTVRLLGGPAAIGTAVEDALDAMGYVVRRVSGPDRYATATAIADERAAAPEAILVTTGTGFADALAASAAAGHLGGVVVLTDGQRLPAATAAYLQRHAGVPLHAIGGPAAAALGDRATSSIAGADRYATAVGVADRWFPDAAVVGVATGAGFPDALAAGARLGRIGAPLVLSPPTSVPDGVGATISRAARVELYGGEAALSGVVESALRGLLA